MSNIFVMEKEQALVSRNPHYHAIRASIKDQASFDEKQCYVELGLAKKRTGPVQKVWDVVQDLWAHVTSSEMPWYRKAIPLAGLVYLVTPADLIPDLLPGLGLVDDVAIILGIAKVSGLTDGIRNKIRSYTDEVISTKIAGADAAARETIDVLYRAYRENRLITGVATAALIALAFLAYFFDAANPVILCTISFVTTGLLLRALFGLVKTAKLVARNVHRPISFPAKGSAGEAVTLDLTYLQAVQAFWATLTEKRSLSVAIEGTIRLLWRQFYGAIIRKSLKTLHSAGKTIHLVKSPEAIEEDVVRDFLPLVRDYLFGNLAYKTLALFAFYGVFLALVKLNVFYWTIHMDIVKVIFYPFTVALPQVIELVKNGI